MHRLRLNYLTPEDGVIDTGSVNLDDSWVGSWIDAMVESNPTTIFFFTTVTTDIFN